MDTRIRREDWQAFCQRPDEAGFLPIYEGSKHLVFTVCRRILRSEADCDDALQSTYTRLIASLRDPARREDIARAEDPGQVLFRLAVREADNLKRRDRRRRARESSPPRDSDVRRTADNPEQIAEKQDRREHLLRLVDRLPDELRVPITLHFFDGLTLREISRGLEVPLSSLSDRVQRGLRRLETPARRLGFDSVGKSLSVVALSTGLLTPSASAESVWSSAAATIAATASTASAASLSTQVTTSTLALGALGMKIKLAAAVAVLIVLACGIVLWLQADAKPDLDPTNAELAVVEPTKTPPAQSGPAAEEVRDPKVGDLPARKPEKLRTVSRGTGAQLEGWVIDAETEDPIEGAELRIERRDGSRTRTDAEGFFRLGSLLLAEESHIAVTADGYAIGRVRLDITEQKTFERTIRLEPGFTLSLRIVDEDGQPLPGVSVTPERLRGYTSGEDTELTNADGRVHLTGIRRRNPQGVSIRHEGYVSQRPRDFKVGDGDGALEYEVTLLRIRKERRAIAGLVTDVKGEPLEGISVQWTDVRTMSRGGKQGRDLVRTQADGKYLLEFEHDAADCFLGVFAEGWTPVLTRKANLGTPEEPSQLDFTLHPGRTLRGRVIDEDGQPLGEVRIEAAAGRKLEHMAFVIDGAARKTRSAADGSFELVDVPAETCLRIWKGGYSARSYYDVDPSQAVELVLELIGSIPGRVVDNSTDEPVTAFNIRLTRGTYWVRRGNPGEAFTDEEGRFVLRELDRNIEYDFVVEADGYAAAKVQGVLALPLDRAEELVVRMAPARALAGIVVDASTRAPLAGVQVIHAGGRDREPLWSEENWLRIEGCRHIQTKADGAFEFAEGRPERLQLTAPGYQRRVIEPGDRRAFELPDGSLLVPLERAATVRVKLLEHTAIAKKPAATLKRVWRERGEPRSESVRHANLAAGSVHDFDTVEPAEYIVVVKGSRPEGYPGAPPWFFSRPQRAVVGESTQFSFGDGLGNAVWQGQLLEADGSPLAHDVTLVLRPRFDCPFTEVSHRVHPGETDRYWVPGLLDGNYAAEVRVRIDDQLHTFELPDLSIDGSREEPLRLPKI